MKNNNDEGQPWRLKEGEKLSEVTHQNYRFLTCWIRQRGDLSWSRPSEDRQRFSEVLDLKRLNELKIFSLFSKWNSYGCQSNRLDQNRSILLTSNSLDEQSSVLMLCCWYCCSLTNELLALWSCELRFHSTTLDWNFLQ